MLGMLRVARRAMSTSADLQAVRFQLHMLWRCVRHVVLQALRPLVEFQGWKYEESDRKVISKAYEFKDFKQAMRCAGSRRISRLRLIRAPRFMNQVADVAEKVGAGSRTRRARR